MAAPAAALALAGSDFDLKVFRAVLAIPKGKVTTYGALARKIGCGGPRAVGNALRRNPYAPVVPCHRIVASTRELGGFCGVKNPESEQLAKKRRLLEQEGVIIENKGKGKLVVAAECVVEEF